MILLLGYNKILHQGGLEIKTLINDDFLNNENPHHHHIWNSVYFYISMDFPIYLPTTQFSVRTFFFEKVWLEDTLPTYSLDICPNFRSFFYDIST